MFSEKLKKIGFTEREASMYLTLLRTGPSQVGSLAKRSNMKRVTAYAVLESLFERGLVDFGPGANGRLYFPQNLECLLQPLEKQSADLKFQMAIARECIEQLNHWQRAWKCQP